MPLFFQDFLQLEFLKNTCVAILLASIACGIVGGYVVAHRQSYMIGAVAHSLLGGVGLARYLQVVHAVLWFTPLFGAISASLIAATAITLLTRKQRSRPDVILSAVWTLGVASGVSFISMTPGYAEDLASYLFGNILLVSTEDIIAMLVLDAIIIAVSFLFHNRFLVYCFREETLELRGVSTTFTAFMLNVIIALTVVLLSQVVGIVLVLVLLVLPAAIAARFAHKLTVIMLLAGAICLIISLAGLVVSYQFNHPTGAVIVEFTVAIYFLSSLVCRLLHRS